MKKCIKCGNQLNDEEKFCSFCGSRQDEAPAPAKFNIEEEPELTNYDIGTVVFGDWKIVKVLGEGGFGKVFEIEKENFGVVSKAACKVIRIPKSQEEVRAVVSEGMSEESASTYFEGFVHELVNEISVMASLKSHPNIVSYENHAVIPHGNNSIGWDILIQMEELTSLSDYVTKHSMTEKEVLQLGQEICDALAFCEKRNLIHRDIKLENIFVSETGHFKLGDFGIARTVEKTMDRMSQKGTTNYMAPEVYLGQPYGINADLYSLGLVLYRLMNNNRLPFMPPVPQPITYDDRTRALMTRMSGQACPLPVNASPEFGRAILKSLFFDPNYRYQTAQEMMEALEKVHLAQTSAQAAAQAQYSAAATYAQQQAGATGNYSANTASQTMFVPNGMNGQTGAPDRGFTQPTGNFGAQPGNFGAQPTGSYGVPTGGYTQPAGGMTPPPKKKKGWIFGLVGGIVGVIVLAIVGIAVLGGSSKKGGDEPTAQNGHTGDAFTPSATLGGSDEGETSGGSSTAADDGVYYIGIVQYEEDGTFEDAYEAFSEEIYNYFDDDAEIALDYRLGDGTASTCTAQIQDLLDSGVDMIVANGPMVLSIAADMTDTVPILGMCVEDFPGVLGMSEWDGYTYRNVSGCSDMEAHFIDQSRMTEALIEEYSSAGEPIMVIYDPENPLSVYEKEEMVSWFEYDDYEAVEYTITEAADSFYNGEFFDFAPAVYVAAGSEVEHFQVLFDTLSKNFGVEIADFADLSLFCYTADDITVFTTGSVQMFSTYLCMAVPLFYYTEVGDEVALAAKCILADDCTIEYWEVDLPYADTYIWYTDMGNYVGLEMPADIGFESLDDYLN